eukprot:PhF_6_TR42444/c0_g1_i1/m.64014
MRNIITLEHRIHMWEWHDLEWVPHSLRVLLTTYLQFLWCVFPTKSQCGACKVVPVLREVLHRCNTKHVVDMCSGAGGPHPVIAELLAPEGVTVTLTDLYPEVDNWKVLTKKNSALKYVEIPVDATNVPKDVLPSLCVRTFAGSFHHFTPPLATSMIQDCVRNRHGLVIVEGTPRNWLVLVVASLLMFLGSILFVFWIGGGVRRVVWTYIFPVFPIMFLWDAVVSHLRCHTAEEIKQMALSCEGGKDYVWESREVNAVPILSFVKLYFFIGVPKQVNK